MFSLMEMIRLLLMFIVTIARPLAAKLGVFEVVLENEKQMTDFLDLSKVILKLDFWSSPTINSSVRFSAQSDPESLKLLRRHLKELNLKLKVLNDNLDGLIHKEMRDNEVQRAISKFKASGSAGIVTYFAPFNEYNQWLQSLKNSNPNFISLISIGKTYEGRNMKVLKISTGQRKEAIFIDGGIHAREWLSISSVVWILNQLITNYKVNDTNVKLILNRFEVYVLPVLNPDGYEYSRKEKNRLWRKNVMPVGNGCHGVDLNRNFDVDFGNVGVDFNPCSSIYPGRAPFSAPESRNLRNFILSIKHKLKIYISFHAFSQLVLIPWGYTAQAPPDSAEIERVANLMAGAIYKTSGKQYKVGSAAKILYPSSGGSDDWVKSIGVKYSYTIEVRPQINDSYGFLAPIEWIKPTGTELYNAFIVAAKSII